MFIQSWKHQIFSSGLYYWI